ncbi:golgin subfamily A member 4 [Rhipicephalus sanguineus]|uniref:golgin subfamily A member 4 n=1 Tax=Rhipicephalus sanguineus TaxID=34632 RepID=UPI0020C464E5|nr:golgin subfamily A member 4 [Rhipicephalus sanguineus]
MFKRLKEKIVEEVKQSPIRFPQFPAGQAGPGESGSNSDASFSITEDDQQPNEEDGASNSTDLLPLYRPPENSPALVAPSDAESETEELSLDHISKEELWAAFQTARARVRKYRNKYSEAVQAYRSLDTEKEKIRRILSESQDKALRRMGELREQAQLEQQAKAHLEENLRCQLEEKEHIIQTLETKVALLKANNAIPGAPCDTTAQDEELAHYKEKVQRLETLMAKCKDTIQNSRERSTQLMQEREALARALDEKGRQLQQLQESEAEAQAKWRMEQQELEQQARQLSESLDAASAERAQLHKQLSEIKAQHQQQLAALEKSLDEERSRAKVADLGLLKQECDKKIAAAEHNWVQKLEASEKEYHRRISEKENELRRVAKKLSELKSITEESEEQEGTEDAETGHGDGLLRDIESYQLVKHNLEQSVQQLKAELTTEQERAAQVQLQLNEEVGRLQAELQKQTNTFHDLQAQLDKALQKQRLSAAEHNQQKRVRELEESLQEVQDSLGKQLFEAEALAKSYEEQLQALQERLASSTKTVATHQPSDGHQQQAHKSETSGHTVKVDEEADTPAATHGSGWDDAWPDEEEWGPRECPADERIEALQMTLGRYRDEINDLRCILRAQQNNNATNHTGKNPVQLPEPTEYEYLRNILFEYMMGKETMTLSKVIAAVLKFSDEQKNQILQRQEARQPQVNSETSFASSEAQVKS